MCGILGVQVKSPTLQVGLRLYSIFMNQKHRGTDGAGLAILRDGKITRIRVKSPFELFSIKYINFWEGLKHGDNIIIHHRFPTHGDNGENLSSNHPFLSEDNNTCLVHNGMIHNNKSLFRELKHKHSFESVTKKNLITDSEVLLHLIDKDITKGLHRITNDTTGYYAISFLNTKINGLNLFKDNNTPVSVYKDEDDNVYFSSELPDDRRFKEIGKLKPYTWYTIEEFTIKKQVRIHKKFKEQRVFNEYFCSNVTYKHRSYIDDIEEEVDNWYNTDKTMSDYI